jgi:hypothetical protein
MVLIGKEKMFDKGAGTAIVKRPVRPPPTLCRSAAHPGSIHRPSRPAMSNCSQRPSLYRLLPLLLAGLLPVTGRAAVHCANNATQLRAILAIVGSNGEADEVRIRNVRMPTAFAMSTAATYVADLADGQDLSISGGWRDNFCTTMDPDARRTVLLPAADARLLRIDTPAVVQGGRPTVTLSNLTLAGVDVPGGTGCALMLFGAHNARLDRLAITDHRCTSALGFQVMGGSIHLMGNLIAYNQTHNATAFSYADGGNAASLVVMTGNTFTGNEVGAPWVANFPVHAGSVKWVENNVAWGNQYTGPAPIQEIELSGTLASRVRNNLTATGAGLLAAGNGNIVGHPDFVEGTALPKAASPLRNAGQVNPVQGVLSRDLAGMPRVVEGQVDIGAFEFESIFSHAME